MRLWQFVTVAALCVLAMAVSAMYVASRYPPYGRLAGEYVNRSTYIHGPYQVDKFTTRLVSNDGERAVIEVNSEMIATDGSGRKHIAPPTRLQAKRDGLFWHLVESR